MTFRSGLTVDMRVERVEEPVVPGFTWRLPDLLDDDPRRTYVEFTLEAAGNGTRLRVVETGFAQLPDDSRRDTYVSHASDGRANSAISRATSMPPEAEVIAEQVFAALADPTRRGILATLAAQGPATATDLANRLPITRQAIAKHLVVLTDAGLVTPEPGERRRVGYRAAVSGCVGPRLGRPSRSPQEPPRQIRLVSDQTNSRLE